MKEKRGRRQHLLTKDSYLSIYGHIVQVVIIMYFRKENRIISSYTWIYMVEANTSNQYKMVADHVTSVTESRLQRHINLH